MAYNIDSSFNYAGITDYLGWLGGGYANYGSFTNNGWSVLLQSISEPGIYLATITVQFSNSPTAFVYITTSYAITGSGAIPNYNNGLGYNVNAIGTYLNTGYFTNGFPPPAYSDYQILAGSLQLNGGAGASAALTTTAPFYSVPGVNTNIVFLINSQANNANTAYAYNIIRIG